MSPTLPVTESDSIVVPVLVSNMTATFTYAKLGKIIPVDPEGNPIPDAPTPQYPNDPTDPGKTTIVSCNHP